MTDTKNPSDPATGCAPLNRPMAETVSLEVVWAAAFVHDWLQYNSTDDAVRAAEGAVAALLAAHPRGGT